MNSRGNKRLVRKNSKVRDDRVEISVDSTYDPDIGDILVVNKKTTMRSDTKEKWWTIGRGKNKTHTNDVTRNNTNAFLAVPAPATNTTNPGSIALRAIRSVRSLARLGGWGNENKADKEKKKEKEPTPRLSTSSFEAGASSPPPKTKGILNTDASRLPTIRPGSSASSIAPTPTPLDVASRTRSRSTVSAGSSLRPLSSHSGTSSSIRWDEECLESTKDRRRRERQKARLEEKPVRSSLERRRRTLLSDVFPDVHVRPIQEAHEETPAKPRPVEKPRPRGICENDHGVMSILDAATNDLALLINHLDLEATPSTSEITTSSLASVRRSNTTTPTRTSVRESTTSLRPYAQSRRKVTPVDPIGKQIAPWPTSDVNEDVPVPKKRLTHKRTETPSPPTDPSPVFQPLRPARGKQDVPPSVTPKPTLRRVGRTIRMPSSLTFGSPSDSPSPAPPSPVFKKEVQEPIPDKPDSDIPRELSLLAEQRDQEVVKAACDNRAGCPPDIPSVVIVIDENEHVSSEDDTKKSFDFTGELKKLNESGASDRQSFVEQLENAFRTPAKIDLRCGFENAFVEVQAPPVPEIPAYVANEMKPDFKFGGSAREEEKPMTLSDIIPQTSFTEEDSSLLNSIFAKATNITAAPRVDADALAKITGPVGFEEIRRGFEFANSNKFYPLAARKTHRRHQSILTIASVSSYGVVTEPGVPDPFDYGLPSLQEIDYLEDTFTSIPESVDDTFAFLKRNPVRHNDASNFSFRPLYTHRGMDAHRRSGSSNSLTSMAYSYAIHGANGGRAAWAHHRQHASVDSAISGFSAMRLGRPGLGDKMFESGEQEMSVSPTGSCLTFDSVVDDGSLFDKVGHIQSSMSSDSIFGYDDHHEPNGHCLPLNHFRPLSVLSVDSCHSPAGDDDTMISMLGGGHIRRRSLVSSFEVSPCIRFEKRKHGTQEGDFDFHETNKEPQIVAKPSIASAASFTFGAERMIKAQRGLLARESLEESCLVADGEGLASPLAVPVFSRPGPAARSRSSTCTSASSGPDTPPLSSSDGSSVSGGSQSSVDLSQLNGILADATHPFTAAAGTRVRARSRARGKGHRRHISQAGASVYETIEEEKSNPPTPASALSTVKKPAVWPSRPVFHNEVHVCDPESIWDDERGMAALRKYYALRDEVETTVTESKRVWGDTPFSVFALQSFYPPAHRAGMQALLEQSMQSYGPLPSELRPRRIRSRANSRPSPYPSRSRRTSQNSNDQCQPSCVDETTNQPVVVSVIPILQQLVLRDSNNNKISMPSAPPPSSPSSTDAKDSKDLKRENAVVLGPNGRRQRVGSEARRTALGWSKRSGKGKTLSSDKKENMGQGMLTIPGEHLRIDRPRPRGRSTPAVSQRPIRV